MSAGPGEQQAQPPKPPDHRPKHPDYKALDALLRSGIDSVAASLGKDWDLEDYVADYVDTPSLAYIALARVVFALGLNSPQEMQGRMADVSRASGLYLEAFTLGVDFERARVSAEPPPVEGETDALAQAMQAFIESTEEGIWVDLEDTFLQIDGGVSLPEPVAKVLNDIRTRRASG